MQILSVLAAALAAYVFGAIWYMTMAKQWMSASNVDIGEDGRPANAKDPIPYLVSIACLILVAGMMRHIFSMSGLTGFGECLIAGFGFGLFMSVPWIATNYTFAGRPPNLILIDGAYATIGSTVIGAVLSFFQ